jgi:hypothetical protein
VYERRQAGKTEGAVPLALRIQDVLEQLNKFSDEFLTL